MPAMSIRARWRRQPMHGCGLTAIATGASCCSDPATVLRSAGVATSGAECFPHARWAMCRWIAHRSMLCDILPSACSMRPIGRNTASRCSCRFCSAVLASFTLVPLVVGEATPNDVAEVIDALWGGPRRCWSVSSDLSHYLDYADGPRPRPRYLSSDREPGRQRDRSRCRPAARRRCAVCCRSRGVAACRR